MELQPFITDGEAQVGLTIIPAEPGWVVLIPYDDASNLSVERIIAWRIETRVFVNQLTVKGVSQHEQVINNQVEPVTALSGSFSQDAVYAIKDSAGTGQPPGVRGMSSFFRSGVNKDEIVFAASHPTTRLYGLLGQRQRPLTKSSKIVRGPLVARFSSHARCASTSG
jgi:hypothetical protein